MLSTIVARRTLYSTAGLALLLLLWSGLSAVYPPILVPSPRDVMAALWRLALGGRLWLELGRTCLRLLAAFALAASLGIALGLLAGDRPDLAALLRPAMSISAGVPPIAWIALALIWFGTGSLGPILVALLAAMPPVYIATLEGVRALDRDLLAMARVFGLRGPDLVREVHLPALTPHLLSGLIVAATLSVRVGIMGEFLASNSGMGSAMALARSQLDTAQVLAWVLVSLGLLVAIEGLLLGPLRRRATAWRMGA